MMKILKAMLVVLISVTSVKAQYDPEAKEILDAMSNKYQQIKAFQADFTQNLTNESAGLNESMKGTITVMDDMYKLEIAGQVIYNDNKNVWSYNKEINEVTVSAYDPEEAEISLGNIWDLYKEGFKYTLLAADQDGKKVIDLNPEDRTKTYYKIRMFINQDNTLDSFSVFENSGNKYTYGISNFDKKPNLTAQYFQRSESDFPDAEIIDFR